MVLTSENLAKLSREYDILIHQEDRGEIDQETYQERHKILYKEMANERDYLVKEDKLKSEEEKKMAEEISKEKVETEIAVETPKTVGKKPVKDSYAAFITKALMAKGVKTFDEVAAKVEEWKPGRESKKIIAQTKVIINLVLKKKTARWAEYEWDAENFLLIKKETSE